MMALIPPSYGKMNGGVTEVRPDDIILDSGPIDAPRVEAVRAYVESGEPLGVDYHDVKVMRATHHKVAMLLAAGIHDTRVAALTNYTPSRISTLKSNPAFRDLVAHYSEAVEKEYADFHSVAADLGMDALQELQARLDESPEKFSISALMELVKTTADRTGNAPVSRSINVNLTEGLAAKLERARVRASNAAKAALADT